jgi:hypothetical protein
MRDDDGLLVLLHPQERVGSLAAECTQKGDDGSDVVVV